MELGKANYGGGKNTFKIKDGDNIYRILPPMGSLAASGKWSMYNRVEWGYKNSKDENRPFLDVRVVNYDTKMVEVESAAHLFREGLIKNKENAIAALKAGTGSQDQVKEATNLVMRYNLDAKHYLNVISLTGEIGLLKLGHKAMLALRTEIDKLIKLGVDPLSIDNGRFFNFHRSCITGNFRDTVTIPTVYNEEMKAQINGVDQMVYQPKVHVIDDALISRLSSEAFDLSGMYPEPTAEEVERIVNQGVTAIDEILGFRGSNSTPVTETAAPAPTETPIATPAPTPAATPVPAAVATPAPTTETKTAELPQNSTTTAPEEAATGIVTETAPVEVASGADLSDADFLKSIGAS